MTTWNHLSRPLRLAIATPWLLLLVLATAALDPAFHALPVNPATHQPTEPLSLASANVVGTLSDDRLSTNIPRLAGGGLTLRGGLSVDGATSLDGSTISTNGGGILTMQGALIVPAIYCPGGDPSIDLSDLNTGYLRDDGAGILTWTYTGVTIYGDLSVCGAVSGNGSALTGYASGFRCGSVDYADYADFANYAASANHSNYDFNTFFHNNDLNNDVSLPGDGTASFANGGFQISTEGRPRTAGAWSIGVNAGLPTNPVEGQTQPISDANTNTWGATITGAGSYHVLAYYDGAHWTVIAR